MTLLDVRPHPGSGPVQPHLGSQADASRPSARTERVVVGLGLMLIAVVYSLNLAGWPKYFDDEGTYYSQAWAVQHLGSLAPYTYWYDHPPVGWLQLALFTWLPDMVVKGNSDLLSGRIVMIGYALVSAALLYRLARRLGMTFFWSLTVMLLWALNPLALSEGRQIFLDNVALPWLLGAFLLALNKRRNLGLHMAAGFCFAISVLSKETTAVFVVPLLVLIWQSSYKPTRGFALMGFAAVTVMTGSMYVLFALVRDELFPGPGHVSLWDALAFQFGGRAGSGSILDRGDEAATTFQGWLHLDPFVLLAGTAAAIVVLVAVPGLRAVGLAVVISALVVVRPSGYLPHMYIIDMLPFCALCLVGLFDLTWRRAAGLRGKAAFAYCAAFVALVAVAGALLPIDTWRSSYSAALHAHLNDTHSRMLASLASLPRSAHLAVDNTYWDDLVGQGRPPDHVVWFYKVDSDGAVLKNLGGSYLGLDYLVWTPYMSENAGPEVSRAFQQSVLVSSFGSGEDRVQLRRVLTPAQYAAQEKAKADAVVRYLADKQKKLTAFYALRSTRFPGLTNGQLEGIRIDARSLSTQQLARKYQTTEATVRAITQESAPAAGSTGEGR